MQQRANNAIQKAGAMKVALVFLSLAVLVACSPSTRQIFFDIKPPSAEEIAAKNRAENTRQQEVLAEAENQFNDSKSFAAFGSGDSGPRPEIESATSWEQALEMLPKDYKKEADWAAAVDQEVVRPRSGADRTTEYVKAFDYDFIMPDDKPKNEAYFPHSAHSEWLSCGNCHKTIFPYKRNPATMKEMRAGASCGVCHGKDSVAFSLTACKRCHLKR